MPEVTINTHGVLGAPAKDRSLPERPNSAP